MLVTYDPTPTGAKFHRSNAFVRGIMGPVGSGKSVMCVMELLTRAMEQAPHRNVRKTRWVVVRNSYRELNDTTIKTFFDWIPEDAGIFERTSMTFFLQYPLPDLTVVKAEFMFRALDRPDDSKKLLSLEITGAFINEAREIRKEVVDLIQTRIGRYPSQRDGGPTWQGLIMDSNPMDTDHWWYRSFEENKPDDWAYFRQPGGLSANAENVQNLPPRYYDRMMQGKSEAWIDAYVNGNYSFLATGKPVYPEFNDRTHVDPSIAFVPGVPIILGADFGLTPAATFSQIVNNRWQVFHEIVYTRSAAKDFVSDISRYLLRYCPDTPVEGFGDPSGRNAAQTDADTVFNVFYQANIPMVAACQQDDGLARQEALRGRLQTLTLTGVPAFALHPQCATLRKGLGGGYAYRKLQLAGSDRYAEKPEKSKFSHVVEALEYSLLGAGEGYQFIKAPSHKRNFKVTRSMRQHRGSSKAV